ncbi:hypothetical protein LTR53_015313, partial [Teratosphaeriaceae sp. CCFEE 6253]
QQPRAKRANSASVLDSSKKLSAVERTPDDDPPTSLEVQRVYRKPRQCVRYTCDQCQTTFLDRRSCHSCGHERCRGCSRNPPKKARRKPDPALLQSVSDKLALHRPTTARPAVAAAG